MRLRQVTCWPSACSGCASIAFSSNSRSTCKYSGISAICGSRVSSLGLQLLRRNVKRFRGGLVFKAHRIVYHSTLGLRVIKKKKFRGSAPRHQVTRALNSQGGLVFKAHRLCASHNSRLERNNEEEEKHSTSDPALHLARHSSFSSLLLSSLESSDTKVYAP